MVDIPLDKAFAASSAPKPATTPAVDGGSWPARVLVMWLVLSILLLLVQAPAIRIGRFGDPDDALRLLEVRDLLAGQSWFDLHQ